MTQMSSRAGRLTLTFQTLPAPLVERCVRLGRETTVRRGTVLARQGDEAVRCYYVRSGFAKVTSLGQDGRQVVVAFFGPGDLIGQAAAAAGEHAFMATATACDSMDVVEWTREAALELAERHPDVHARLDALLLRNAAILLKRLHTVTHARVPRRLATVLLELVTRCGRSDATGFVIEPRVTRQDLADLTGTTLYTVSRTLAEWQRRGILTSRRGRICVIAPRRLGSLARGLDDRG